MVRRFSIAIGTMLVLPVAVGALLLSLVSLAGLAFDEAAPGSWVTIRPEPPLVDPGTDVAAGRGDSGGPVFTLTNDGGIEARGTTAGGSREVACGRHHLGGCTANVFFVDVEPALAHHHAELVTTNARA